MVAEEISGAWKVGDGRLGRNRGKCQGLEAEHGGLLTPKIWRETTAKNLRVVGRVKS